MPFPDPRRLLRSLFDAAVAVADPMRCVPAALPPRPAGRVVVIGAGKASARMAEAVEAAWGPCEGLGSHPLRLCPPDQGHRDRRGGASGARRARAGGDGADARSSRRSRRGRRRHRPDLRRRLGAPGAAGRRDHAGREAGGQRRAPRLGSAHRRDERRAQAPQPGEGRPARRRRLAGAGAFADDLGHPGRRPGADRLRPDGGRRLDARRRAGGPRALVDPDRPLGRGRPRRAEPGPCARRAPPRPDREPGDRRPLPVAGRGRRRGGGGGLRRPAPRRRHRGRGARGRRRPGPARPGDPGWRRPRRWFCSRAASAR